MATDVKVTSGEVTDILKRIAAGEVTVSIVGKTWDEIYAGDVVFQVSSGERLTVFNDCDGLDYIDAILLPDGRSGDFDDWADDCDPLNGVDDASLYEIFKAAQPNPPAPPDRSAVDSPAR